ncbi:hypothetical protein M1N79_04305 [Dehalococcoidia bacterium]|nr:hypothetical protein [Dehalococcoidia bacterium]
MDAKERLTYFELIQGCIENFESETIVLNQGIEIIAISSQPARYLIAHPKVPRVLLTNMMGQMILNLCSSKRSIGDIRDGIVSKFQTNVDPTLVLLDIVKFIRMAKHHGIVHASLT